MYNCIKPCEKSYEMNSSLMCEAGISIRFLYLTNSLFHSVFCQATEFCILSAGYGFKQPIRCGVTNEADFLKGRLFRGADFSIEGAYENDFVRWPIIITIQFHHLKFKFTTSNAGSLHRTPHSNTKNTSNKIEPVVV